MRFWYSAIDVGQGNREWIEAHSRSGGEMSLSD